MTSQALHAVDMRRGALLLACSEIHAVEIAHRVTQRDPKDCVRRVRRRSGDNRFHALVGESCSHCAFCGVVLHVPSNPMCVLHSGEAVPYCRSFDYAATWVVGEAIRGLWCRGVRVDDALWEDVAGAVAADPNLVRFDPSTLVERFLEDDPPF